jgi:hypothetical protein
MNDIERILALEVAADERRSDDAMRVPKATSWGIYSYGDAPAAIGGGMGSFIWFDNKTALLKFVAEVLPFCPPGPSSSDLLAVEAKVREVLAGVKAGDLDLEKARKRLNVVLRSYSQIEWIGTFKGLKDGNDAYSRKLIKQFRRSRELPVGAAPVAITRSQVEDFKEFLAEYGI